jgi:hypothetical protein
MAKGKEIATRADSALAMIASQLDEEASGFNPTPVVIQIVHTQGMFAFPALPPESRLTGVILASRMVRVFFPRMAHEEDSEKLTEITGGRPFCSSQDYIHGTLTDAESSDELFNIIKDKISEGAGNCVNGCPLNKWGSTEILGRSGRGKACAELRRLLFWRPGMQVPAIFPVPTSSIKAWDGYCSALGTVGQRHNRVITEITAEVKSATGMKWSVLKFAKAGDVTEEMAEELVSEVVFRGTKQTLIKSLVDLFAGREIAADEYPINGSGGDEL